jgi:predicted Zn-dependent protease
MDMNKDLIKQWMRNPPATPDLDEALSQFHASLLKPSEKYAEAALLLNQRKYKEALPYLQELLLEETNLLYLHETAQCYYLLNQYEEALSYSLLSMELYPEDTAGFLMTGLCLHKLKRDEEAEETLLQALIRDEYCISAYAAMCSIYMTQKDYISVRECAATALEKAIEYGDAQAIQQARDLSGRLGNNTGPAHQP